MKANSCFVVMPFRYFLTSFKPVDKILLCATVKYKLLF